MKARQSSAVAAAAAAFASLLAVVTQLTQPPASDTIIDSSSAVVANLFGGATIPLYPLGMQQALLAQLYNSHMLPSEKHKDWQDGSYHSLVA